MTLHPLDIAIIVLYMLGMVVVGFVVERRARAGISSYFLGGNEMPWWILSMSNAASMFDISGTMWLVSLLYIYGLKSVFIPWLWPVFNQIFMMIYLSAWLRRSGAVTGAEWITLRFGSDAGAEASRISVVIFALVSVIAFTGYAFVGIALFAAEYLPGTFTPNTYALVIIGITTLYTVVGGLYSVVVTDMIQFLIMIVCSFALGFIAMWMVSPESLAAAVPAGWSEIRFGWLLDLDWSSLSSGAQGKLGSDGWTMFSAFMMMMVFKGVLISAAGPAPNYDMQRVLASRSPREASMMSGLVTVVLFVPRYFMIAGIAVLAIVFLKGHVTQATDTEFERLLPIVIRDYVPIGLKGLLIAGLLAAFMSTFSGTINAAAAYLVNDVYKRYYRPNASSRDYIRASYAASLAVVIAGCTAGYYIPSVTRATSFIVSGLWVGYAAPNVLKWHWWRLNGWGYFGGMISGIVGAVVMATMNGVKDVLAVPAALLLSNWADLTYAPVELNLLFKNLPLNLPTVNFDRDLMAFPMLLVISLVGAVLGSLLTRPEREDTLVNFYVRTRPWGWWGPIHAAALRRDPAFQGNRDFSRDVFNVVVGTIWQTAFVALPVYVVIQHWREAGVCLAIITATSATLKVSWYDRLGHA